MTIERQGGRGRIVCDDCGAAQDGRFARDEFPAMVAAAKAEGFVFEKVAGEWEHECADCARRRPARAGRLL